MTSNSKAPYQKLLSSENSRRSQHTIVRAMQKTHAIFNYHERVTPPLSLTKPENDSESFNLPIIFRNLPKLSENLKASRWWNLEWWWNRERIVEGGDWASTELNRSGLVGSEMGPRDRRVLLRSTFAFREFPNRFSAHSTCDKSACFFLYFTYKVTPVLTFFFFSLNMLIHFLWWNFLNFIFFGFFIFMEF